MNYTLNDVEYLAKVSKAESITLHWEASNYDFTSPHYHINIDGKGTIYSDYDNFDIKLPHTWHRNTGNIGIGLSCCVDAWVGKDGSIKWGNYPPTDEQIETMAQVVAAICKGKGWEPTVDRVRTHAEWAKIDGYSIYDSDPDMRWDLLKIPQEEGNGGDILRGKARFYMAEH